MEFMYYLYHPKINDVYAKIFCYGGTLLDVRDICHHAFNSHHFVTDTPPLY